MRLAAADADALEAAWLASERAHELVEHPSEHDRLKDALTQQTDVVYRVY